MLAWLLATVASHLMLHFGPIQALDIHGHRLVIIIKDDRSVITAVLNNDDHVLHYILPDRSNNTYCLRPKRHERH